MSKIDIVGIIASTSLYLVSFTYLVIVPLDPMVIHGIELLPVFLLGIGANFISLIILSAFIYSISHVSEEIKSEFALESKEASK